MKAFLDANILVAVLNKEYPLFTHAARILSLSDSRSFKLFTSPVCIAIAFYFAEKKSGTSLAKEKIKILCANINITKIDSKEIQAALQNKKVNDLEDGIEYYSAIHSNCETIITEDSDGFYYSEIEVVDSKNFLEKYLL